MLDFLFPRKCFVCGQYGGYVCKTCYQKLPFLEYQFCPVCSNASLDGQSHQKCQKKLHLDGLISILSYHQPTKILVEKIKYK